MDKRTLSILSAIVDSSKNGEAIIMEKSELLGVIPQDIQTDIKQLDEIIKELTLTEFIQVKYKDDNQYGLIPLSKAQLVVENQRTQILEKSYNAFNINIDYKRIAKVAFRASFVASLLASLMLLIIAYFVLL